MFSAVENFVLSFAADSAGIAIDTVEALVLRNPHCVQGGLSRGAIVLRAFGDRVTLNLVVNFRHECPATHGLLPRDQGSPQVLDFVNPVGLTGIA